MPNDGPIDVAIATKNSARTIGRCLDAIKAGVPFGRLIVVDGGSTDGTVEIATDSSAEVHIERGPLGVVRHRQGELAEGEWLAIIDSDVYIYPSWWPTVKSLIRDDTGIILGSMRFSVPSFRSYERFLNWHLGKFGGTAFTNALVRRKALAECDDLLENVHAGEDAIFVSYLRRLGLTKVFVHKELFYHDQDVIGRDPFTYLREGAGIRRTFGVRGIIHVLERPYAKTREWVEFSRETRNLSLRLFAYLSKISGFVLVGFLLGSLWAERN